MSTDPGAPFNVSSLDLLVQALGALPKGHAGGSKPESGCGREGLVNPGPSVPGGVDAKRLVWSDQGPPASPNNSELETMRRRS